MLKSVKIISWSLLIVTVIAASNLYRYIDLSSKIKREYYTKAEVVQIISSLSNATRSEIAIQANELDLIKMQYIYDKRYAIADTAETNGLARSIWRDPMPLDWFIIIPGDSISIAQKQRKRSVLDGEHNENMGDSTRN